MKKSLTWSATLAAVVVACSLTVAPAQAVTAPPPANLTAQQTQNLLDRIKAVLPADYQARFAQAKDTLGIDDGELRAATEAVINPAEHECAPTPLSNWLSASVSDWELGDLITVVFSRIVDVPSYDVLLYGDRKAKQSYGKAGEFTRPVTETFGDLKRFWDIQSRDIQLMAMHGSTLLDPAKVARTSQILLKMTPEAATEFGGLVVELINQEKFDFGEHPLFTFNAFAYSALGKEEFPGLGVLPDKIIMGDGVLEGFKAIGLADVAPKAVLAHEFGHHIQYERNLFESTLTGPEATRRTELMADAFAAYYLTHARGANLNWKRTKQFLRTFHDLGDCGFTSDQHHGTPNQRMRAAEWGNAVAENARKQGHIMSTVDFARLFERALPSFVAPDVELPIAS